MSVFSQMFPHPIILRRLIDDRLLALSLPTISGPSPLQVYFNLFFFFNLVFLCVLYKSFNNLFNNNIILENGIILIFLPIICVYSYQKKKT